MKKFCMIFSMLALALMNASCGNVGDRVGVSGSVTLDGAPLTEGRILFSPAQTDSGESSNATAQIQNGKFKLDKIKGLIPGEYVVSFTATKEITGEKVVLKGPQGETIETPVTKNLIPDDFGQKSTQRITIVEGKNVLNFSIPARTGK